MANTSGEGDFRICSGGNAAWARVSAPARPRMATNAVDIRNVRFKARPPVSFALEVGPIVQALSNFVARQATQVAFRAPRPLRPKKSPAKPPGQFIREETPRKGRSGSAASQDCL